MQQMCRAAIFRLPGSYIPSKYVRSGRIIERVLAHTVDRDLPVQMRTGGKARAAHVADHVPAVMIVPPSAATIVAP